MLFGKRRWTGGGSASTPGSGGQGTSRKAERFGWPCPRMTVCSTKRSAWGGFTLACDAQIYPDLLRTGLRGPEPAGALHEGPGFARHGA